MISVANEAKLAITFQKNDHRLKTAAQNLIMISNKIWSVFLSNTLNNNFIHSVIRVFAVLHIAYTGIKNTADIECTIPILPVLRSMNQLVHFRHLTWACWKARDSKRSVVFMILQSVIFILIVRFRIKSKFHSWLFDRYLLKMEYSWFSNRKKETEYAKILETD